MTIADDIEAADRVGRRRARLSVALAVMLLLQQVAFSVSPPPSHLARPVDYVGFAGWVSLSIVLVLFLWTGGMWRSRRTVRALLNDDDARANRAAAMSLGFVVAMAVALLVHIVSLFMIVGLNQAIHLIVSCGIVTALLRFGILERRGFGDSVR